MDIQEKKREELLKPKTVSVSSSVPARKIKIEPKKINQLAVDLEIDRPAQIFISEIKTLNIDELQSKFNFLLKTLYKKYNNGSENVHQISGIVPPSIVENSINYKFLLEIFPIFINEILKLDKALQKELIKPDFDIDIIDLFENITQLKVMIVDILKEKGKGNFTNFNKYIANLKEKHPFFKKFINSDIQWYKEDTLFLQKENTSKIDAKIESLISIINRITKKYFPEHEDISRNDADLLNKLRKIVDDFNKKAESFNIKNKNNENKNNQNVIEYLQKLKRIKTIIDVLIKRILPSNYNQIRYDVKSSVIDKDIKENLDKYLSKNTKNGNTKNENNKTNEELKNELNQLLIEMYKKFLPKDKIPQMGNTSKEVVYLNSDLKPINTTNRVENLKPKNNTNPVANLKPVNTTNPVANINQVNTTNPFANINPVNTTKSFANLGTTKGGSRRKIIK
jgi:hypothetical protein